MYTKCTLGKHVHKKNYNTFSKIKRICYRNDMGGGGVNNNINNGNLGRRTLHCRAKFVVTNY